MTAILEARNITKAYVNGDTVTPALRGVSLTVEKGEFVAIMGPSGSGKSTLMNLMGLLDTPTSGSYLIDGVDVSFLNDNELAEARAREIGFVFQSFNLLPRATDTASTVTNLLTVLLGSIAGISLLVGGIGIMNMMLTTVTERIREIGLRKAIGATRSDITSQFLAEAVALTMTGGAIGILGGWGIASAIAAVSSVNTRVTSGSVLLAVGVSTAIGLIFGYYPARRAAKLDPIEALRYQ